MSKIGVFLRKNSLFNHVMDELFVLRILKKNLLARPIRKQQTIDAYKVLSCLDQTRKHVFFLGIPMHNNLGDQTQRYCIEQWIKTNYPNDQIISLPTWPFYDQLFRKRFIQCLNCEDLIFFQSGYCTTDRHFDHPMHLWVAKHCPNNKIIFMPQTVKFFVERKGYAAGKVFARNQNIVFLARDKTSFEMAERYFPHTHIELFPDIATTLIGSYEYNHQRNGIFICARNDGEKKYTNEEIADLQARFINKGIRCDIGDTNSTLPIKQLIAELPNELDKILSRIASYQVVITDRYHGTIFSLISNTPVIVIASNDHKVKTGTEWFIGVYDGGFYNANSLSEAYNIATKLLEENKPVCNTAYFQEHYYNSLNGIIHT